MVFTAIGQTLLPVELGDAAAVASPARGGQSPVIGVDADFSTSLPGVFAGGDCVNGGGLTVQAVAHGKRAAASIHAYLGKGN
jgi:glutamate synthase (NADPH/NADH) small chain